MFGFSLLFSAVAGLFAGVQKNGTVDINSLVLANPLIGVEKAHATGDAGDCCGSSCDGGNVTWPDPYSTGIVVGAERL